MYQIMYFERETVAKMFEILKKRRSSRAEDQQKMEG